MQWMNRLERKYGSLAVRNLMFYIIAGNALVFALSLINSAVYGLLILNPHLVLQGQVWRLVTYIFIPPTTSVLWIIFTLYFYYMVGSGLEQEWGAFRFNLYYFLGMACTTAAAFITGTSQTGVYLNLSLFLAFAHLYPDFEVLLFFFLPVKMKYLAWLNWALIAYTVLFLPVYAKIAAAAAVVNFFVFFGRDIYKKMMLRRQVARNRRRFFAQVEKARRNRRNN